MDLKVAVVVVSLCALAITSTEAGIPKCCMIAKTDIPIRVLMKVQSTSVQRNNGACDIHALILHVKGVKKPICAHPKVKGVLMRLQWRMKQINRKAAY